METLLESLSVSVGRLKAELELHEVLSDALAARYAADDDALRRYIRRARRATYATIIVGSYGLMEQTVDSVLIQTAESYGRIFSTHGDVPDVVRKHQRELLLGCLKDGDKVRTRLKVSDQSALGALAQDSDGPPQLVPGAFTVATANYRFPYVQMLFNRLGVVIGEGLTLDEPKEELAKTEFVSYESFLEDLVQRRNDLAHSYGDDNLIAPDMLVTYVDIMHFYLRAVIRVARFALLRLIAEKKLASIGSVVKTWQGRLGIQLQQGSLKVGDRILLLKPNWTTSHTVESLKCDGMSFEQIEANGASHDVSAQIAVVPSHAVNAVAYVIPPEWVDLWPSDFKWGHSGITATDEEEEVGGEPW